jgi:anti-sigma factor RsiW
MIKPPSWSSREEVLLLVSAYFDGELDAATTLEVERRMNADLSLKEEYDRLVDLRQAIASHVPKDTASAALRRRVEELAVEAEAPALKIERQPRSIPKTFDWRQMAAAIVIAAGVGSTATYLGLRPPSPDANVAAIVAGHQRALLAPSPFEVASSDTHTVKPWFDSKLALSPRVVDLSGEGFPLVGGRVDTVGGRSVPAIVYKRREHVISVIAVPRSGNAGAAPALTRATKDGYTLLGWQARDFDYTAVSDVADKDLDEFVALWRASSPPQPRDAP